MHSIKEPVSIHIQSINKFQSIQINGSFIYDYIAEVKHTLLTSVNKADGYIIDLKNVQEIDIAGFGILLNFYKKYCGEKCKLGIVTQNYAIRKMHNLCKLYNEFPILEDEQKAIHYLSGENQHV